MIRVIIIALLLATPGAAWCQGGVSSPGDVLALEQAVALALENNRQVKNAALDVRKAEQGLEAGRTHFLPVLNVSVYEAYHLTRESYRFDAGTFGTYPGIGPIPATDTDIGTTPDPITLVTTSATQPLSQLYRISLSVDQLKVARDIAQEALRLQQQEIVKQVKNAYYGILQTQSALEATAQDITFLRELDLLVNRYVKEQTALKSDSLEVKTRLSRAEYAALTQRNALATQKEQLNDLLGRDVYTQFSVSTIPEVTNIAIEPAAAQSRALSNRPEVREARLKVKQAKDDYRIKQSEYIPDVSFMVEYTSPFNIELLPDNMASVGVYASWEFFDWGRKSKELGEKRAAMQQAQNTVRGTESSVMIDVNSRIRKVEEAQVLLQVAQLSQETAREKLRVTMDKYSQKAALLQDVLQAQASLADANNSYQQAVLSFWTARADLEKALGEE